ncbi:MAG: hypothetical protein AB8F65_03145 [Woeseiaceae bacterium]
MNDDDIPVLTTVVKRERRAELTLTPERRQAITHEITESASAALHDMLDDASEQVRVVLQEQLLMRLTDALPAMIESVLQTHIDTLKAEREDQ